MKEKSRTGCEPALEEVENTHGRRRWSGIAGAMSINMLRNGFAAGDVLQQRLKGFLDIPPLTDLQRRGGLMLST
jgi:hypothetical protein